LFIKLKNKFGKLLIRSSLSIGIRKLGLNICGFSYGRDVYIGEDCIIISELDNLKHKLIFEDRVSVAPRVTFILSSNPNNSYLKEVIKVHEGSIHIEQDAWIGTGVIIYPNIRIGRGSIIASGSVVTKDVEKFNLVGGIPAKKIKNISNEISI
jgi:acetyltransferase-like isoleucine patch superfamily enzyme